MDRPITVTVADLQDVVATLLRAAGVDVDGAKVVAEHLVLAEIRGHSSHGLSRLPTYVERLQAGLINGSPSLDGEGIGGGTALLDGDAGFGHVVGRHAMSLAIGRARDHGIGAVGARNSTHFGMAGVYARQAADEAMIGIVCSNAAARMPAVGATLPVVGSNPLAVAAPTRNGFPILLDMATSAAAVGKIIAARDRGESIPDDWALGADGRATTDPEAALGGLLMPAAGFKGFGLALVLEILSSVLTGAATGRDAGSMYKTWDRPENLGHFFIAISIEAFVPVDTFLERIDHLAAQVKGSRRTDGGEVYLPGELESLREAEHRRVGVALPPAQLGHLSTVANALDVTLDLLGAPAGEARVDQ